MNIIKLQKKSRKNFMKVLRKYISYNKKTRTKR